MALYLPHIRRDVAFWEMQRYTATSDGGLSASPYLAGAFAVQIITFVAAAALFVYSYRRVRPARLSKPAEQQFFGLRIALGLFVVATFFAWLFMAFAEIGGMSSRYLVFSLFPFAFYLATEVTLLYTLIRLAWQPLVHARGYKRAKGVGIGLCVWFGLIAGALWATWAAQVGAQILDIDTIPGDGNFSRSFENALRAMYRVYLIYWCFGALWGLVVMGAAIDALRKSRGAMKDTFRTVPKLVIPASILWFVRFVLYFIFRPLDQYGITFLVLVGPFEPYHFWIMLQPLLENVLLLIIFGLCFMCFRTELLPFYSDSWGTHDPTENLGQEE